MEFHEKLQELRKKRGLTQEELANDLFVSRTAISKWESGRGYPNIDSLKEISRYFSVSIDELLSGEKILDIAEEENKSNIQKMCELLLGFVDVFFVLLILLPLYPMNVDGYILSVNLFEYTSVTRFSQLMHWGILLLLIVSGFVKICLLRMKDSEKQKWITDLSIMLNILLILCLALSREAYAITIAFMLFVIKMFLILKKGNNTN